MNRRQLDNLRIQTTAAIAGRLAQAKAFRERPIFAARLTKTLVDAHVDVNRPNGNGKRGKQS